MSIWTSLSGIRAHQNMLDVIGNNLANANTTGFKMSQVVFSDMMNMTLRSATSPTSSTGGTNPVQIGTGVNVGAVTRNFTQGRLQDTGNALDLAMNGNGFMVLNDGLRNVYSRSFTAGIDAAGNLVDSVTGYRLLGISGQPISIPFDEQLPAQATTNIQLAGNLSTGTAVPVHEVLATAAALTAGGAAATAATDLSALDSTTAAYTTGDVITVNGTGTDGQPLAPVTFTYGTDGTTAGALLDKINATFAGNATAALDAATGKIILTADAAGPTALSLALSNTSGTGATDWTTHAFAVEVSGSAPGSNPVMVTIFDSVGNPHTLTLTFERTSVDAWKMTASLGDVEVGEIANIKFNSDGSFNSASSSEVEIDYHGAAADQTLRLTFGTTNKFDGLTLFAGNPSAAANQDGSAPGVLNGFTFNSDGSILGLYTNGEHRDISQMQVVTFDNPAGLESVGNGLWVATSNSGNPVIGTAQSGRAGAITSSALEGSNVDTTAELTKLIVAQYGFQVNSRALSVTNQTMQQIMQNI